MSLTLILIAVVAIFIVALIGGLFPVIYGDKPKVQPFLAYGEALAKGIFLGVGLIHLLPDAISQFALANPDWHYPLAASIVALTIVVLLVIEQGVGARLTVKGEAGFNWEPYLLLVMLSIHSLIAGSALGADATWVGFFAIFLAVMAHKGSAAFALGVTLKNLPLQRSQLIKLMVLFAAMTPIGVLIGSSVSYAWQIDNGHLLIGIFNAVAAGTFIYLALSKFNLNEEGQVYRRHLIKTGAFVLGLLLMAVLAFWL